MAAGLACSQSRTRSTTARQIPIAPAPFRPQTFTHQECGCCQERNQYTQFRVETLHSSSHHARCLNSWSQLQFESAGTLGIEDAGTATFGPDITISTSIATHQRPGHRLADSFCVFNLRLLRFAPSLTTSFNSSFRSPLHSISHNGCHQRSCRPRLRRSSASQATELGPARTWCYHRFLHRLRWYDTLPNPVPPPTAHLLQRKKWFGLLIQV